MNRFFINRAQKKHVNMQMFFKEEVSIYHQMFSRESQKSNSGLHILEELVSRLSITKNNTSFSVSVLSKYYIHFIF